MDYNKLAATVLRLLTKYGQVVVLKKIAVSGAGSYDPATGGASVPGIDGENTQNRKGLPTDQPGNRIGPQYGQNMQTGDLIINKNKWIYIDANGLAPTTEDRLVVEGIEYNIIDVQKIQPGNVPLLYLLVLKV
jgi:hypothetical protein